MKKIILLSLTIMLAFTGGCGMTKEKDNGKVDQQSMPETEAFQDEFTREFMKSTEETEEGYYTFESKTKGYTMLFPVNAKIASTAYDSQDDFFETYNFGESVDDKNLSRYITVTYEDKPSTKDIKFNLELLSEHTGYDTDFREIKAGDNIIFYSKGKKELTHKETNKKVKFYSYFAYVQSQKSEKGIQFFYQTTCKKATDSCEIIDKDEEEKALLMMKSINFIK
ncbi:hypothetical protein MHB63_09480 [Bacillus sp. FSL H8-0547]